MDDTDNAGNEFRLQKISEIQKRLETEKEKRRRLTKKYKKGAKVTNVIDYVLATSIMGLSVVGVYDYSSTRGNHDRNVDGGCWCTVHTE